MVRAQLQLLRPSPRLLLPDRHHSQRLHPRRRRQEEEKERAAAINTNSAKAEAKLVKALDYLAGLNDSTDNPAQKWVINESILASLTGCYRPAIKKFFETHHGFI
jgi:hypothetical protein